MTPSGQGLPDVESYQGNQWRQFPLGIFFAGVAKATLQAITTKPQVTFRGVRLVIPAAVGANFTLNDIKVGQRSQFVSATQLPSAMFAETAVGVAMVLDTCTVGQDITVTVTNTDAANPHDFSAAIIGDVDLPG
jgi:hypothetical protein